MNFRYAFLALAVFSAPAFADQYRFTATGTVGNPYSVDRNFRQVPDFPTSIKAGDRFSVSFVIDPSRFTVQSLYDADPTINIYNGSIFDYSLSIGVYNFPVTAGSSPFATTQLWNNYISSNQPTDAFTIGVVNVVPAGRAPISLTSATVDEVFNLSAFDWTATARTNDLISQITPLTGFSSLSASIGYIDPVTYDQTTYSINGLVATITAVPENSTWVMMLTGVAAIGATMRRRRKIEGGAEAVTALPPEMFMAA